MPSVSSDYKRLQTSICSFDRMSTVKTSEVNEMSYIVLIRRKFM